MRLPKKLKFIKKTTFKIYLFYFLFVALSIAFLAYAGGLIWTDNSPIDYSKTNEINININLFGFQPNSIQIEPIKEYVLIIRKGLFVQCDEIEIETLNINTKINNQLEKIPLRISQTGTYNLRCKDGPIGMQIHVRRVSLS